MASGTNRSLQQKAEKLKVQIIARNAHISETMALYSRRVQIERPWHERHEQRTKLLAHW